MARGVHSKWRRGHRCARCCGRASWCRLQWAAERYILRLHHVSRTGQHDANACGERGIHDLEVQWQTFLTLTGHILIQPKPNTCVEYLLLHACFEPLHMLACDCHSCCCMQCTLAKRQKARMLLFCTSMPRLASTVHMSASEANSIPSRDCACLLVAQWC